MRALMNNYYDNSTEILDFNISPPKTQPEFQLIETNIKVKQSMADE
jgi:hypothetical protein